jgi:hypothetical protein
VKTGILEKNILFHLYLNPMQKFYSVLAGLAIALSFSSFSASAQSFQDRYFKGAGFSFFDVMQGPLTTSSDSSEVYSASNVSIISLSFTQRLNLIELGNNSSFSADLPLTAGFGSAGLSIVAPFTINYNLGNISTYNSDSNKGFMIGAGMEYIFLAKNGPDNEGVENVKKSWVQPVGNIAYRFWNKANKAREVNLKVGYGSTSAPMRATNFPVTYETVTQPTYSFRLSFTQYFNY